MGKQKSWTVYKHIFPNGKVYIGITGLDVNKRWRDGFGYLDTSKDCKYSQRRMFKAIVKYGWINIAHEIIAEGLSEQEAKTMEMQLIGQYKSNDYQFGYNLDGPEIDERVQKNIDALQQRLKDAGYLTMCDQTGAIYPSMKEAARQTGISVTMIRKSCREGIKWKGLSFSLLCNEITGKT